MSPHQPPPPPGPFDDLQFLNNPFNSSLFPSPPPLPSSAELFSPSETTDLFGFLENFNYDFDIDLGQPHSYDAPPDLGLPQHHFGHAPPNGLSLIPPLPPPGPTPHIDPALAAHSEGDGTPRQRIPSPHSPVQAQQSPSEGSQNATPSSSARPKALLSTPQKRRNHILSEQKRRNAIRDGYVQLTALLAPAGAPPGTGMPTRGRPKGSGGRGRGSRGKSGILFKAREYIHFLEEGRDALLAEVLKVEAAAGKRLS